MSTIRVAALQMRSGENPQDNLATFEALVREAAGKGAAYVQSPEMTGILVRGREKLAERVYAQSDDPLVRRAGELRSEERRVGKEGGAARARTGSRQRGSGVC